MFVDFEFANRRLSELGLVVGHITTSSGTLTVNIGSELTFTTVKNNQSSVHSITSSSYDNVYKASFEIFKRNCYKINPYLSDCEIRELNKWLNRKNFNKFKPVMCDFESEIIYYGSFNTELVTIAGKAVGLILNFITNAPYAFTEPFESQGMLLNKNDELSICGDSDEYGVIYPKVTIHCFADGELKIKNSLTGTETIISNCINGETITLDGTYKISLTDNQEHEETLYNNFNYCYLDILVDEDCSPNVYTSTLPCELTISYSSVRKVGVY